MKFTIIVEQNRKDKYWQLNIRPASFLSEGGRKFTDSKSYYYNRKCKTKQEAQEYGRQILKKNGIKEEDIIYQNDKFYTAEELAETLKLNIMTIYRYIKAGKLKAYKIGKEYRIDKDEFNKLLTKSRTK